MQKALFVISVFLYQLILSGCKQGTGVETQKLNSNQFADSSLVSTITKFSIPYPADVLVDSNSLIFYGNKTIDTSILIIFLKRDLEVAGTYYEVLPEFHRNLNDLKTVENKILFFNGYGFSMEANKWPFYKALAKNIPQTDLSKYNNPQVLDGDSYTLCFDHRIKRSNPHNVNEFENFYTILKDSILNNVRSKRVPLMHKKTK